MSLQVFYDTPGIIGEKDVRKYACVKCCLAVLLQLCVSSLPEDTLSYSVRNHAVRYNRTLVTSAWESTSDVDAGTCCTRGSDDWCFQSCLVT